MPFWTSNLWWNTLIFLKYQNLSLLKQYISTDFLILSLKWSKIINIMPELNKNAWRYTTALRVLQISTGSKNKSRGWNERITEEFSFRRATSSKKLAGPLLEQQKFWFTLSFDSFFSRWVTKRLDSKMNEIMRRMFLNCLS